MTSKAVVQGTDGSNYEVTADMIKIDMKTEKINSKCFFNFASSFDPSLLEL